MDSMYLNSFLRTRFSLTQFKTLLVAELNNFYQIKLCFWLSLSVLLLSISCNSHEKSRPLKNSSRQTEIEKVQLINLENEPIDLAQYKSKVVFINFWATWCGPCRSEMPSIKELKDSLKDENIVFLFASDDDREEIEDFASQHNYGFEYVKAQNLEDLNITGLPTTFIFNQQGHIVFSEMGARDWDSKENIALIKKIIKP